MILKKHNYAHFQVHNCFWVTTTIGLHALMLKKHISFSVQSCNMVFPIRLIRSFSSFLFEVPLLNTQSALIGQLTHTWTSTINNKGAAVPDQFLHAKLATSHKLCKCMIWWHSVMTQWPRIIGRTTDKAFPCFLWERAACVGVDFDLQPYSCFVCLLSDCEQRTTVDNVGLEMES